MSAEHDLLLAELNALPNPATPLTAQDWDAYKDVIIRMDKNHTRRTIHEKLKLRGFTTSLPTVHQRLESWGYVKNKSKKRPVKTSINLSGLKRHKCDNSALMPYHTTSEGANPPTDRVQDPHKPHHRPARGRPLTLRSALQAMSSPSASRPPATVHEDTVGHRFLTAAESWIDDLANKGLFDDASWLTETNTVNLLDEMSLLVDLVDLESISLTDLVGLCSRRANIGLLVGIASELANFVEVPQAAGLMYLVRHFLCLANRCLPLAAGTLVFISRLFSERLGDQHPMAQVSQALLLSHEERRPEI